MRFFVVLQVVVCVGFVVPILFLLFHTAPATPSSASKSRENLSSSSDFTASSSSSASTWCLVDRQLVDDCGQELHDVSWANGNRCQLARREEGTSGAREGAKVRMLMNADKDEQFTVVLNGLATRTHLLSSVLKAYDGRPRIAELLVVWAPPGVKPPTALELGISKTALSFISFPKDSLNNRFAVGDSVRTEAVLSHDDDMFFREDMMETGFRTWQLNRQSIVGVSARAAWASEEEMPRRYLQGTCGDNIVLTNMAFLPTSLLREYSKPLGPATAIRKHVDSVFNCEDIAMNFVAGASAQYGPPVRLHMLDGFVEINHSQGLSGKANHRTNRINCLDEFQAIYGFWPLRNASTYNLHPITNVDEQER